MGNFFLLEIFSSKMQNSGPKTPKLKKLGSKLKFEILSTHSCLCRKFAAVCRKIATSCHVYFLAVDAAEQRATTQHWVPQARKCRTTARHFLACDDFFYGVLRHLKADLVRPMPYLISGDSSKTAFSCNAELMVSFCTL